MTTDNTLAGVGVTEVERVASVLFDWSKSNPLDGRKLSNEMAGERDYWLEQARQVVTVLADAPLIKSAPEMLIALCQYRDDLMFPVDPDSIERRLAMVNRLIAKATGGA